MEAKVLLGSIADSINDDSRSDRERGRSNDVLVTGETVDGIPFRRRRLNDIAVQRANGSYWLRGYCPETKRSVFLRLDLLRQIVSLS